MALDGVMLTRLNEKMQPLRSADGFSRTASSKHGSARVGLLAVVSFLLGVGATAAWFHFNARQEPPNQSPPSPPPSAVSESTGTPPAPNPATQPVVQPPVPVSPETIEAVKRAVPNYASLSLDEGTEMLREAAVKEFTAAASEMQSQVAKARNELDAAQNSNSADDQQAAMKHLQDVQKEQTEKLQQIAAKLQTQIAALKQLKGAQ